MIIPIQITFRVDVSGKVDISDLTWEQKERVLRYLFSKVNGARDKRGKTAPPSITNSETEVPKEAWYDIFPISVSKPQSRECTPVLLWQQKKVHVVVWVTSHQSGDLN